MDNNNVADCSNGTVVTSTQAHAAPWIFNPPHDHPALAVSNHAEDCNLQEPQAPLCFGCNLRIVDKFYLSALDSKWHTSCLKCSECGMELESQVSCYERDGLILCKEDYLRIYGAHRLPGGGPISGTRQCARCQMTIGRDELVMKARCHLYHVECFKCVICDVTLIKGDLFGMFDAVVYCQTHFRQQQQEQQLVLGEEFGQGFYGYEDSFGHAPPTWSASPSGDSEYANSNDNSIPQSSRKKRGRRKRDLSEDEASRSCFPYLDPTSGLVEKTKRARTSFKHHQLRIMKSHFQMNQNPDSRELKELATKTGLDKKVLQVWFQNARAKWRRMNNSQGMAPSGGNGGAEMPPVDSDVNHPFGP